MPSSPHPRYAEMFLGVTAWALISNYLGTYVLTLLLMPMLYFIVLL